MGTRPTFDDPAVVGSPSSFGGTWAKPIKIMPTGEPSNGAPCARTFLEGKTAIMWHSTDNLTAVKDNASFDFGVAMLPASKRRGTPTGGGNFYIFKKDHARGAECGHAADQIHDRAGKRSAEWSMKTGYMGVSSAAYETPRSSRNT
jgi:sn-glycerol 3-phosphate transport system substrate-binding protein